jgi:hypothetical protein
MATPPSPMEARWMKSRRLSVSQKGWNCCMIIASLY